MSLNLQKEEEIAISILSGGPVTQTTLGRKQPVQKRMWRYFKEYTSSTSIHGFRYLGEPRTIYEKTFWLLILLFCLYLCFNMITINYNNWKTRPLLVSFGTKEVPIYSIPFPAVTICPERKFDNKYFNSNAIRKKFDNNETLTDEEKKLLTVVSTVCAQHHEWETFEEAAFTDDTFFSALDMMETGFLSSLEDCAFLGMHSTCDNLITPIITDDGVCYSFNVLDKKFIFRDDVLVPEKYYNMSVFGSEWSLEAGYSRKDRDVFNYPFRALLSGTSYAFQIIMLQKKTSGDYNCGKLIQGYKVLLHTSGRVPIKDHQYFRVAPDQEVIVLVSPDVMKTPLDMRKYNAEVRGCYFSDEKYLRYFKTYMQLNCQMECLANATLQLCGCVMFYMPRLQGTPICGPSNISCVEKAKNFVLTTVVGTAIEEEGSQAPCDCIPTCNDVSYSVQISQTNWEFNEFIKATNVSIPLELLEGDGHQISKLKIYFRRDRFIPLERREIFDTMNFLAACGGILGLCMGFSIVSFIEIVYFLSLRLIANVKGKKRPNNKHTD